MQPEIPVITFMLLFVVGLGVLSYSAQKQAQIQTQTQTETQIEHVQEKPFVAQAYPSLSKADRIVIARLMDLPIERLVFAMQIPELWEVRG